MINNNLNEQMDDEFFSLYLMQLKYNEGYIRFVGKQ